ncbi:MAG: FliH/SctL family protein [Terracidiphilus sp.]
MNSSSSNGANHTAPIPVSSFMYRDIAAPAQSNAREQRPAQATLQENQPPAVPTIPVTESDELVRRARAEAVAETEKRLKQGYEDRLEKDADTIRRALELFEAEKKTYFSRVESDVVHLALAIATKILHREAQVDPMLVAALVRIAVDKLHDGSSVSLRVSPVKADKWRDRLANPLNGSTIAIIEDGTLKIDDCILETDLGSANFSIDAQLKEVEQGFFDLLAQRPPVK